MVTKTLTPFYQLVWMKINEIVVIWYFSKIVACIFEFYLGQQIVVIAPTVLEKYANAFGPRCVSWLQLLQRAKLITITRALG